MNSCPKCGGDLLGDGYRYAIHCEYAKEEDYEYNEPDAEVTLCDYHDDDSDACLKYSGAVPCDVKEN